MKDFFTNYGMAFVFLSLGVKYIQSTHTTFFELKSLENFKPHFKRLFSMYLKIQICKSTTYAPWPWIFQNYWEFYNVFGTHQLLVDKKVYYSTF